MALRTQPKTSFPSHAVSDIEKAGEDYGLQVANAIELDNCFYVFDGFDDFQHDFDNFIEIAVYTMNIQWYM